MSSGIVLVIAGVWLAAQIIKGGLVTRLGLKLP